MADYGIELNSNEFKDVVRRLVKQWEIDEVVETGTFMGTGSTKVFAGEGLNVFTIECNVNHLMAASENLKGFPNVCFTWTFAKKGKDYIRSNGNGVSYRWYL